MQAKKTEIPVTVYEEGITLTLSKFEAHILYAVMSNIGGSPSTSPRKVTEQIYSLIGNTITINHNLVNEINGARTRDNNSIYFKDNTLPEA